METMQQNIVSNQSKEFNNSLDAKKYICSILMHKE